ncbi:MAG: ATP-binding cassette domain-containing protein, partial [Dehalococcoidia bacterium]
ENLTAGSLEAFRGRVRVNLNRERGAARQLVEAFGIVTPSIETPIELLSGGNQQKAILARWFPTDPAVVLLDEPTQGIDVGAKVQIHNHVRAIASRGAAVLVASSEQEELASLCDRVLVLQRGHVVRTLAGDQLVPSAITHALYNNSPLPGPPS